MLLGIGGKYMTHRTAGRLGTLGLTVITVLAYVMAYRYFGAGRSGGVWLPQTVFHLEWLRFTENLQIELGPYFGDDAGCHYDGFAYGSYL